MADIVMSLNHVKKMIKIFASPKGWRAFAGWKPFSITSFFMAANLKKIGFVFKTVIDGGANIGQFTRAVAEVYPTAKIISFEPLPDVSAKFLENLGNIGKRVELYKVALGEKKGKASFHRNSHSHSSSILKLHENHKKAFPNARETSTIKVPVVTLDGVFADKKIAGPVLLKLDLQGFELNALKGGKRMLKKVDAVLLETALKPLYENEPTFDQLRKFLKKQGLGKFTIVDSLSDRKGNVLQMDVLFTRGKGVRHK